MVNKKITLVNKLGLHTRAAAKLVAVASRFDSKIEILSANNTVTNCKSIMGIILLGATQGTTLDFVISGADELEARDAIVEVINNRFGEAE